MKKLMLISIVMVLLLNCYSQTTKRALSDVTQITYKDLLDIKLQILAAQMTSGSYSIIDMGRLGFPISILINDQNKIIFSIEGDINNQLSEKKKREIISECCLFAETGLCEMIRKNFNELDYDYSKNIIGYWYYKDALEPCAKWENNNFGWIKQ
jgi:hypothetical protein